MKHCIICPTLGRFTGVQDKLDVFSADEHALDVMAHDLSISDYEIGLRKAVKVELVKENIYRNKFTKGTAEMVRRAVAILYDGGKVSEWLDTGGKPYTFNVKTIVPNVPDEAGLLKFFNKVRGTVERTKNARSHLDGITLFTTSTPLLHLGASVTLDHLRLWHKAT